MDNQEQMKFFILEGGVFQPRDIVTNTTQLAPIPYEPPLMFTWYILFTAFMIGLLVGVFLMAYLNDRDKKHENGKLVMQGSKMYRIRYHEIELKEKD